MTNESIINVIRNYWRFDHRQQHTHTWYDREDFIRHHLVPLAARIAELEAELAAVRDKYVREGIERVMEASRSREGVPDDIVERACKDALSECEEETER